MGVLPDHAPLLAQMDRSARSPTASAGQRHHLAVTGGFAEVLRRFAVSILARSCERAEEIDIERARRSRDQRASTERLKSDRLRSDSVRARPRSQLKRAH